jgi:glycosyltransferase involved in cell wall biosynthesis
MTTLSAIVPATDAPPTLSRALQALEASSSPPEETFVIQEPAGVGPAHARNVGALQARGDVLVFVDADVVIHSDALARIRRHFDDHPQLTAVLGAYDDQVATRRLVAAFRNLLHHHVHERAAGPAETFWAGLGAVRREAFTMAGGFDARRYAQPSIEDIELGLRLADRGAVMIIDPAVRGTHLKDWTLRQMLATDLLARGAPWVELLLERRSFPTTLNLGWRDRASVLVSIATATAFLRGRFGRAIAGASALVAFNWPLYRLLRNRLGAVRGCLCIPLHIAHHLAAAASVPTGIAAYLVRRRPP